MKVEHITILGSSVIRDTQDIALYTVNFFKDFQINGEVKTMDIPKTPLRVKITSTSQGTIFDMMKGKDLLFTNICSFNEDQSDKMYNMVIQLASMLPNLKNTIVRKPNLTEFIYTVPVPTIFASADEIMLCAEIEFYIYYSLYLAHRQTTNK